MPHNSNLLNLKSNLDNRNSFEGSVGGTAGLTPHENNLNKIGPAVDAAFNTDGGIGDTLEERFFHGKANPGMLDGKKIGALDLHVQLLNDSYEYNRAGFAGSSGPAPGGVVNSFADLNLPINNNGEQEEPEKYSDKMNNLGLTP